MRAVSERVHPDVVWEHNIGGGSPDEGVYRGRESVVSLFERILEPWEYLRAVQQDVRELGGGAYQIRGELHAKHVTSAVEIVTPYEQTFELCDGLLAKGAMTTGAPDASTGVPAAPESGKLAIIRRYVEAFNRRDFDWVVDALDPDVELHEWPEAPGARSYRGRDGVRRALDSWFETWEWMEVEILDILETGERVLVTLDQRARGRASSAEVEVKTFNVYTFGDGKVTRMELFTEREPALEAAGLTESHEEETR
jgi:ketosteroid isomerase-like protein